MYLKEVSIKNFRIFDDFQVVLNPGMNIIVGENNTGKTALLDAIRYALGTTSGEWIHVSEDDFHNDETHFQIQLKFDKIEPNHASVFVEHLTHEECEDGKRKSVLYVNYEATLTDQLRRGYRYIKVEAKSGQKAEGPRIDKEIRDYLSATYLKPLRDAETEMTAGRGSRLSQILSSAKELSSTSASFNDLIGIVTDANQRIVENEGIRKSKKNIQGHVKELTFSSEQFEATINILDGKNLDEMTDIEKGRVFRSILEKLNLILDDEHPLQGLGYNNVLFIATELLLLQQEQDKSGLLLIEEPEAHLHPQLQMKLLEFMRKEYCNEKPKLQCIMTTHSPNLASKASLDSLILMTKGGKAFSLRKNETELDPDDYVYLEKFLDVTKSNLFFAKAVVLVEGDGENILLPTIANQLGRSLEDYGVSVINIGNTAFARYAKIFQRKNLPEPDNEELWNPLRVACLRDLDIWPEKAEKKSENEPFGFKLKKEPNAQGRGGNLMYWRGNYNDKEYTELLEEKKSLENQNVKVFLSDHWTFEYALILSGLAEKAYEIIKKDGGLKFEDLPKDPEERAIYIYGLIDDENRKTELAYELAKNISSSQTESLKEKLPKYIVQAIEYVTAPLPVEDTKEDGNEDA